MDETNARWMFDHAGYLPMRGAERLKPFTTLLYVINLCERKGTKKSPATTNWALTSSTARLSGRDFLLNDLLRWSRDWRIRHMDETHARGTYGEGLTQLRSWYEADTQTVDVA